MGARLQAGEPVPDKLGELEVLDGASSRHRLGALFDKRRTLTVDANPWPGLDNCLFLPQWLMVLILVWLVFAGGGARNIDAGIASRLRR